MQGVPPNSLRDNYFGTQVHNNTNQYVPEDVLLAAAKLRQLLIDHKLCVQIAITHPNYEI